MNDIPARVQRVIDEMTGNEALWEMLDTDAAIEMLEWGKTMVRSVVQRTGEMDDFAAELTLLPRLKAIRQTVRWVGNWAAGKYVDPAERVELRDKLLAHFRTIFGEETVPPSGAKLDAVLDQVDDEQNNPQQLILKLKETLNPPGEGDLHAQET
jgi:hypothetical protein